MKRFLFLLVCWTACNLSYASHVLSVGITERHFLASIDAASTFSVLDYVCVIQNQKETACGFVTKIGKEGALVDLEFRTFDIEPGLAVRHAIKHRPCDPEFTFPPIPKQKNAKWSEPYIRKCTGEEEIHSKRFHLPATYYFSIGTSLLSPKIAAERLVFEQLSLGLSLNMYQLYSSLPSFHADSSGFAYGSSVFLSYYPFAALRNLYGQIGIGYAMGRLTLRGDLDDWKGLTVQFLVGYRFMQWQNFAFAIALGGNYFKLSGDNTIGETHFVSPVALIEFGIGF